MDERQRNLGVRIVQATLGLEAERDASVRALITKHLEEDQRDFGAAPEALSVHRERALGLLLRSEQAVPRDQHQAMVLAREATAEALWAGDWESAVAAYRLWRRMRLRVDPL